MAHTLRTLPRLAWIASVAAGLSACAALQPPASTGVGTQAQEIATMIAALKVECVNDSGLPAVDRRPVSYENELSVGGYLIPKDAGVAYPLIGTFKTTAVDGESFTASVDMTVDSVDTGGARLPETYSVVIIAPITPFFVLQGSVAELKPGETQTVSLSQPDDGTTDKLEIEFGKKVMVPGTQKTKIEPVTEPVTVTFTSYVTGQSPYVKVASTLTQKKPSSLNVECFNVRGVYLTAETESGLAQTSFVDLTGESPLRFDFDPPPAGS